MPTDLRSAVTGRLRLRHWVALDVLMAGALWATCLVTAGHRTLDPAVGYLVVTVMAAPIAVRRLWPLPVLVVVAVAATAAPTFGVFRDSHIALALALYPVLVRLSRHKAVCAAAGAVVTTEIGVLAGSGFDVRDAAGPMFSAGLMMTTTATIGIAVGLHRTIVRTQRDQAAVRAVTQERLRIAREMHDVIAHGMSVITVQAGVARYVADTRPEEARRALESIEETGRAGLAELRRMLAALRAGNGTDDPPGALGPAPGLADLDVLVVGAGRAGVRVSVDARGNRRPLPAGMDQSAYRIVQEALTNVVRHAGPAQVTVVLDYQPDALAIEIVDNGRGAGRSVSHARSGPGHGLLGMRERVSVYGGRLDAGPLPPPDSGFRVSALLPMAAGQP